MLDEAYAGPCAFARDPRPSRKVVSTLQVSRFMARQVHNGSLATRPSGAPPSGQPPEFTDLEALGQVEAGSGTGSVWRRAGPEPCGRTSRRSSLPGLRGMFLPFARPRATSIGRLARVSLRRPADPRTPRVDARTAAAADGHGPHNFDLWPFLIGSVQPRNLEAQRDEPVGFGIGARPHDPAMVSCRNLTHYSPRGSASV
jgi:hypothetical protein